MFGFLFKDRKLKKAAHNLFALTIAHTRLPVFYTDYSVEDSLDGRFDLMALHMSLIMNKLDQNKQHSNVGDIKRMLQEAMFDNLDLAMREVGVGDLGVGKKIKVMAEAFYGRIKTYQEILDQGDLEKLQEAIKRNLSRERDVDERILTETTAHFFQEWHQISAQEITAIMAGKIVFTVSDGLGGDE